MRPLTQDDLLPFEEFACRRREIFTSHQRYLERYRRVRIGPSATLLFENRQTLWFRVQEVLRIARLVEPALVQGELDLSNRLLPGRDQLQAALLIDGGREQHQGELIAWASLRGDELRLCIGDQSVPADLLTCRPEDRCAGTTHWVKFIVSPAQRRLLLDFRKPACCELQHEHYRHASLPLSEEMRQSFFEDLEASERD